MSNIRIRRRQGRELPDLEVVWLDGDETVVDLRAYSSFRLVISTRSDGLGTVVLDKTAGITAQDPADDGLTLVISFSLGELDDLLAGRTYKCQLDAFDVLGRNRGFEEFDWSPTATILAG